MEKEAWAKLILSFWGGQEFKLHYVVVDGKGHNWRQFERKHTSREHTYPQCSRVRPINSYALVACNSRGGWGSLRHVEISRLRVESEMKNWRGQFWKLVHFGFSIKLETLLLWGGAAECL